MHIRFDRAKAEIVQYLIERLLSMSILLSGFGNVNRDLNGPYSAFTESPDHLFAQQGAIGDKGRAIADAYPLARVLHLRTDSFHGAAGQ